MVTTVSIKVDTTKTFQKQYRKLPPKIREQYKNRVALFITDRGNKQLNDHRLRGNLAGYNSINISGDYRALYYERPGPVIIFSFIGTHHQLYGK
jgi:addiction module RelE/StbE family toxin